MNKVMLVTGGGRGIGAATAILAALNGFDVCVNFLHNEEAAREVVASVEQTGRRALAMQADVSTEANVIRLFENVDDTFGPLSALVNNVGVLEPQSSVMDLDEQRINRILRTNVTSYFLCAKQAVLRMSTAFGGAGGTIVNVSSAASRTGSPHEYVDYAASKGAIDTLTRGLSLKVADAGIRVNAVRPGFIHTDIHADGGDPDRIARLSPAIPMKRGGTPQPRMCPGISPPTRKNWPVYSSSTITDIQLSQVSQVFLLGFGGRGRPSVERSKPTHVAVRDHLALLVQRLRISSR